jgi:hypothetical protein
VKTTASRSTTSQCLRLDAANGDYVYADQEELQYHGIKPIGDKRGDLAVGSPRNLSNIMISIVRYGAGETRSSGLGNAVRVQMKHGWRRDKAECGIDGCGIEGEAGTEVVV